MLAHMAHVVANAAGHRSAPLVSYLAEGDVYGEVLVFPQYSALTYFTAS
jgi:hypothetical protein